MLIVFSKEMKMVDNLLEEDYALLADLNINLLETAQRNIIPAFVLSRYKAGRNASYLAAACQCFYLFFHFHSLQNTQTRKNILLGDYFFSRFMELLITSDNISLLDHFSNYVIIKGQNKDFNKEFALGELLPFISSILKEANKEVNHSVDKAYSPAVYGEKAIRPIGLN